MEVSVLSQLLQCSAVTTLWQSCALCMYYVPSVVQSRASDRFDLLPAGNGLDYARASGGADVHRACVDGRGQF